MIFHFSGTGNSLWVAKQLGEAFNEKLIAIADELNSPENSFTYSLEEKETVFFVFPVHSWGPAALIKNFVEKIKLKNYNSQAVYIVCSCGDNCGDTDKIIEKMLLEKAITVNKVFSIQMPNTYILMKGFGIDYKELEKEKLEKAPRLITEIIENIRRGNSTDIYERGNKTFLKSRIVYPLFIKYAIGKNKFFATDKCTSCKLCANICPTKTIEMKERKPVWKNTCIQCTACIHRCPTQAIEYGNITQNQGRYHHPEL